MSRIGKLPIQIPSGVTVEINGQEVFVKGSRGQLKQIIPEEIKIEVSDNQVVFTVFNQTKNSSACWGLSRALVNNMIKGVTEGFEKKLEIEGVGYKAVLGGADLVLSLGFSHPIIIKAPQGIVFKVEKNVIIISGIDKKLVGQISADIRAEKKPEPYKGKGIHYLGEVIRRKAGKKATATAS
ncbi:MAG: 50S ribosomal protein L6 [Parcubacteria group bacterium GW2011_GWC1_38_17]|uniref:Large ribosomal subunit protein uL6 n=1 Tax=Candidatus Azambacteria bacterium RIFCSPLOWO2_01_FULL_37_9 TaxID=1797297 RepID=A0A1F5C6C4_9BACT|nr:MAG: 50S ribosomal protein L6 [Candidatus Moranbacteria bacterium GW2011_GWF2_37_7]KKQ42293.1 MAG: 50S ribosomal protein L6 [Parcubacteria group bacterium GW2011_GWE2_37_8]KKQ58904.1 MAG: 50S ribosomal protein L6 [Parcubacteria group bacterium GW2011_GWC1_38_17]OGD38416.1 MAG: 50S ribosomal protein L6 [Candidatus Azambacteria bacterium RIFCSPLOWO2_01_FULL_37_9]